MFRSQACASFHPLLSDTVPDPDCHAGHSRDGSGPPRQAGCVCTRALLSRGMGLGSGLQGADGLTPQTQEHKARLVTGVALLCARRTFALLARSPEWSLLFPKYHLMSYFRKVTINVEELTFEKMNTFDVVCIR